jgi:DNA-binding NtrC family response regulator
MGSLEAQHIAAMLREMGGNKRHAAEILGISTRTLYRKIKQFALD